jgi:hypothetical protein
MLCQQREKEYGQPCEQEDRAKHAGAQAPSGAVTLRLLALLASSQPPPLARRL